MAMTTGSVSVSAPNPGITAHTPSWTWTYAYVSGILVATPLDHSGALTDNTPTATGSGAALVIYNALVTLNAAKAPPLPPAAPTPGQTTPPYMPATSQHDARPAYDGLTVQNPRNLDQSDVATANFAALRFLQTLADQANAIAQIVPYIQANATAHVTSQILGRTPSPNNANTNIQAPLAAVDIPIT